MPKLITPQTHDLAQEIVARWSPGASVTSMTPGEAGLAPFKVSTGADVYCLKVPIVVDDSETMSSRNAGLKREARWAYWAGSQPQVAPPVAYPQTGAYAARFLMGSSPTAKQMQTLRKPIFNTLHRLHSAPVTDLPAAHPSDDNWLLTRDVASDLAKSKSPCSSSLNKGTLDLLTFLEDTLDRHQVPGGVIHNDLHLGNIIVQGEAGNEEVRLIDWANARLADPMVDVAHYCHELIPNDFGARPSNATLARDYDIVASGSGIHAANIDRIALHLARFDVRRQAFQRQWSPDTEMSANLRFNCRDLAGIFAERGFATPQAFK